MKGFAAVSMTAAVESRLPWIAISEVACGGELTLAERSPGAHFELAWPCAQGTPVPVRPSLRRLPLFAGRTFVVCDDDRDVADLLSTGLEARANEEGGSLMLPAVGGGVALLLLLGLFPGVDCSSAC